MYKGKIIGASIGNCVHVAGAVHFLNLAEDEGYEVVFLGPAISVREIIDNIKEHKPDMVALGYRLTPENGVIIVRDLIDKSSELDYKPTWLFGGTAPVAKLMRELDFFDVIFDGTDDIDDSIMYLRTGQLPDKSNVEEFEFKEAKTVLEMLMEI